MTGLISRAALIEEFMGKPPDFYHTSYIVGEINCLPSVDAVPVVHGRWGENGDCSECGFQPWYERDIHTLSYCPNCGADMRAIITKNKYGGINDKEVSYDEQRCHAQAHHNETAEPMGYYAR